MPAKNSLACKPLVSAAPTGAWSDQTPPPSVSPALPREQFGRCLQIGTLGSPASWDRAQVERVSKNVLRLVWVFRARPDLLVVTARAAIWLELKVETSTPAPRRDG